MADSRSHSAGQLAPDLSLCHRWPAGVKLCCALLVIVVSGLIPLEHWPAQGLLLVAVFMALSLAGVTLRYLARRLLLFLPALFVFGLSIPVASADGLAWNWAVSLWLRCTVSFLAGLWLIHVLPLHELLTVLRRWHCPVVLIAMIGFMYRYVFILWDELRRLRSARDARDFGGGSTWREWSISAQLIGLLLLRAMERAERTHRAMLARGWDGTIRSLDEEPPTSRGPTEDFPSGGHQSSGSSP